MQKSVTFVAKGQSLYEMTSPEIQQQGKRQFGAQIEVINEKIMNAEDIITNFHNKEETRIIFR